MRSKLATSIALFLALVITVPILTSCETIVTYLVYEWIDNEFNNNDSDREEPQITSVSADRENIFVNESVVLTVKADDKQDSVSDLEFFWVASAGTLISPTSATTIWNTPATAGKVTVSVIVKDTDDNQDTATFDIEVMEAP